jgi:hypothetical protein
MSKSSAGESGFASFMICFQLHHASEWRRTSRPDADVFTDASIR